MSQKRRDSRNRVLRNGESQRKDGRYAYKYIDFDGSTRFVYSWKLEPTDKVPTGKRDDVSLREKEKQIRKDLDDGIESFGGGLTVGTLVEQYLEQKTRIRNNTRRSYNLILEFIKNDEFGKRRIDRVKQSDAKSWFIRLGQNGRTYSSINLIRTVVLPAFQMAVEDEKIRKNPFSFKLSSIIPNDSEGRVSISEEDEARFLDFLAKDNVFRKYYDVAYILLHTGLRISEFAGLTFSDIDMNNRTIDVNHQLMYSGKGSYYICPPKTERGTRVLPMEPGVYESFRRVIDNRGTPSVEPLIDGKIGFLFLNRNGQPTHATAWDRCFQRICNKYNRTHDIPLPLISPHVCRHTYCTKMAKSNVNPKVLQYLMGHSNISVTFDVYTHVRLEDVKQELQRVSGGNL